jgi:uncharacterized membrane protein
MSQGHGPTAAERDRMFDAVSFVLTWGFRVAFAALAVGLLLALARGESLSSRVEPISQIAHGIGKGNAAAFVDLGIVLLLLTPPEAVATVLVVFARRRDPLYTAISLIVLAVLAAGIVLAFR